MQVTVEDVVRLHFPDGAPVRAASAIVRLGDGWLIAQDDGTEGCRLSPDGTTTRLRLLPPVEGHDTFDAAGGTKHLKPDLEAACVVPRGVLLLGSGSTSARMRGVLVGPDLSVEVQDLSASYAAARQALGVAELNLEGACVVDGSLRWFQRRPASSVEMSLPGLDRAGTVRHHDLGRVEGVAYGVTDAVTVPGGVLVSLAAEDSPDAYADGPVVASALALLRDDATVDLAVLAEVGGRVAKVEGLAVVSWSSAAGRVLAVVDADDPTEASLLLTLSVVLSAQRRE